ncbi:hypothetical protein AXY_00470 [Amphibacillus xylanus NBRC 15112]|uniref:VanZ-like domain-containing protein n=2 Tax=Amphibacillus xylanus TaxID=1449 RepID=K0IUY7_AMPXN|nr:hypothetical protein AXY_00470 [Amphibacillus xylanus NBRC 15112]
MSLIATYLQSMFIYSLIGLFIYGVPRIILIKKKQLKIYWLREIILSLFVAYLSGLLSQTIMPDFTFGVDSLTRELYFWFNFDNINANINLIPFKSITEYLYTTNSAVDDWGAISSLNLLANLMLFLPLGIFAPLLWIKLRSFKSILLLGIGFVTTIEFIQYFIGRSSDIDDIILNSLSILIGFSIFRLLQLGYDRYNQKTRSTNLATDKS